MNKLNKLLSTIFALTLLVALPAGQAFAGGPVVHDLMAGQHTPIGTVTVSDDGAILKVEFMITNPEGGDWQLLKTQVLATVELNKKQQRGAPGQFEYQTLHDAVTSYTYNIPLADLDVSSGDELIVAFHADVQNSDDVIGYVDGDGNFNQEAGQDCPTLDEIGAALPGQVSLNVSLAGEGYFQSTITGGTSLDGTFTGWCIDAQHYITPGANYDKVNVYSSYEELPPSVTTAYTQPSQTGIGANSNIDKEENLDLVNWVTNNRDGYSDEDVQNAIWQLIDDNPYGCSAACQELVNAAYANGENFEPNFLEGEVLAVILQAVDSTDGSNAQVTIAQVTIAQVTLIELGLECTDWDPVYNGETAWAIPEEGGSSFPKSNHWGQYSEYTVNN